MKFDVVLPTVVLLVVVMAIASYQRAEKKIKGMYKGREFSTRDAVILVVMMGLMVTVIAFTPGWAIQILFLAGYSLALFSFAYLFLQKMYVAIIPPALYVLSYFLYRNAFTQNVFAVIFAIFVTMFLATFFSWRTTWIFAVLLTMMDVFQVFVTGFMGESASKMLSLNLPVAFVLPMYPAGSWITLGLGDVFLSGLLSIQTTSRDGLKTGILAAATISGAIFIFEVAMLNAVFEGIRYFPATVVVIAGWATSLGIKRLIQPKP